jgi:hypothetical protein
VAAKQERQHLWQQLAPCRLLEEVHNESTNCASFVFIHCHPMLMARLVHTRRVESIGEFLNELGDLQHKLNRRALAVNSEVTTPFIKYTTASCTGFVSACCWGLLTAHFATHHAVFIGSFVSLRPCPSLRTPLPPNTELRQMAEHTGTRLGGTAWPSRASHLPPLVPRFAKAHKPQSRRPAPSACLSVSVCSSHCKLQERLRK